MGICESKSNTTNKTEVTKEIIQNEQISKNHPIFEDDGFSNTYSKISEGIDSEVKSEVIVICDLNNYNAKDSYCYYYDWEMKQKKRIKIQINQRKKLKRN